LKKKARVNLYPTTAIGWHLQYRDVDIRECP
jgi:hypothetical protein